MMDRRSLGVYDDVYARCRGRERIKVFPGVDSGYLIGS